MSTLVPHTLPLPSSPNAVLPHIPSTHASTLPSPPSVCVGLTGVAQSQGEAKLLDWLEEAEEGSSEWVNAFFTFLYGLINPLEDEEEPRAALGGVLGAQEDDEEEDDEGGANVKGTKDDANRGQKIVIVGLHNQ